LRCWRPVAQYFTALNEGDAHALETDLVRVSPYDVFCREITIKGSFAEINSFPAAIAALRTGRARTESLITHRFQLDDYAAVLDALRSDRTVHKIIIECRPDER
jgi:D-arabinitol dehydrogenase (NADP+)